MVRTSTAVVWNLVRVIGQTGLGIVTSVVLARMLSPEDFGIIAATLIFVMFSEIVASVALSAAIVQRENLSDKHINTAITMSPLLASFIAVVFWFLAEPAAVYFQSPLLVDALRVLIIGMWAVTMSSVFRGLLMREMAFKQLMVIDFVTYAIGYSVVGIGLAYLDYGVWSMVYGTVAWQVTSAVWLWWSAGHRYKPQFFAKEAKELVVFGSGISINNMVNFFTNKSIETILGGHLGMVALGLYNRAATTAHIPFVKIAVTISQVMLASYSQVQNDQAVLRERYFKAIRLISSLSIPVLAGLYASGEYVITGMYGEKWRAAGEIFQILCIFGMFNNILHLAGAVVQATGSIYREVRRQVVVAILTLFAVLFAVDYGLVGVAWAAVFASVVLYLLMAQLSLDIVGGRWRDYFLAQLPALTISIPIVFVDYWVIRLFETLGNVSNELGLLLLIGSSGITFVICLVYFPDRWIGGVREWLLQTYSHKLPNVVVRYLS